MKFHIYWYKLGVVHTKYSPSCCQMPESKKGGGGGGGGDYYARERKIKMGLLIFHADAMYEIARF